MSNVDETDGGDDDNPWYQEDTLILAEAIEKEDAANHTAARAYKQRHVKPYRCRGYRVRF